MFYIDIVVSSSRTLINVQRIGNSAPLHSTAAVKFFLANCPTPRLEKLIEQLPLEKYTDTTFISVPLECFASRNRVKIPETDNACLGDSLSDSKSEFNDCLYAGHGDHYVHKFLHHLAVDMLRDSFSEARPNGDAYYPGNHSRQQV